MNEGFDKLSHRSAVYTPACRNQVIELVETSVAERNNDQQTTNNEQLP